MCIICVRMNRSMCTSTDPDVDFDDEGFMILSTEDIEEIFSGMPEGGDGSTEPPDTHCECMVPDVAVYTGLNKTVEYCKSCKKDMPK